MWRQGALGLYADEAYLLRGRPKPGLAQAYGSGVAWSPGLYKTEQPMIGVWQSSHMDWLSQLGYIPYQFTLQLAWFSIAGVAWSPGTTRVWYFLGLLLLLFWVYVCHQHKTMCGFPASKRTTTTVFFCTFAVVLVSRQKGTLVYLDIGSVFKTVFPSIMYFVVHGGALLGSGPHG